MTPIEIFKDHAEKTLKVLGNQLSGIYETTLSSGLIETINVSYHGQKMEIKRLGLVSEMKGRVSIATFDKTYAPQLAKELKEAGYNAYVFSKGEVCINIPPRCQEEAHKICAYVRKLGENAKVAIRNARKKCKQKQGDNDEIQKITDSAILAIDKVVGNKCSYILK